MNDSAGAHDLDEARFRANLIRRTAEKMGLPEVLSAAEEVAVHLGPIGCKPLPGYGRAMLQLAKILTP